MSTQLAVTPLPKAAPPTAWLSLAMWAWLGAATGSAALALALGGAARDLAGALALAVSPVLAAFILMPWLGSRLGVGGILGAWLIAATGLAAGSGGWASPMLLALVITPALAVRLRPEWARVAAVASVGGYVLAGVLGRSDQAAMLGAFPVLMGAASLGLAAMLLVGGRPVAGGDLAHGRRVAEVSHELRTPLTHILGFSEMIERQMFGELNERYVEYAGLIRRSGSHLLSLVNDLLDLSRIDAGKYELEAHDFDARDVVADVVRQTTDAAAKRSITLGMLSPDAPLMVRADDRALRRILLNTIGNAVKFTPEGGRVMVSVFAHEGVLRVDTIDNGVGIPEAERDKLGNAYQRGAAGAGAEGTGLGLSLVRALARLHGGALSFHEAPGGGALVRVEMPVLVRISAGS